MAIAPIIKAVAQRIGWDEAISILQEANQKEAFQRGKNMAEEMMRNGIEELIDDVAGWGHGGILEMDVLEQTPTTYFFNITRCPYYDKYKELGLEKFGVGFSCCRDKPFARGFNPQLRLERTKTIMEGSEFCDFRFFLDDK